MAKTVVNKIFKQGKWAQYAGLASKDADTLYFIYDKKMAFRGEKQLLGSFDVVNSKDDAKETGVIYYILPTDDTPAQLGYNDGTGFKSILDNSTIDDIEGRVQALENATKIDGNATAGSIGEKVAQLDGADTVDGSVKKQIKDAVAALDVTDTEVEGSVVVAVSEEDGKVSSVKKAVAVAVTDTTEGMQKTYDVTIGEHSVGKIDIPFCDAVLFEAKLSDMNATLDKDGHIVDGTTKGADALVMSFKKGDGTFDIVKVNIATILTESEFKDGLAVSENGEVSVKLVENNNYLKFGTAAEDENAPLEANVVTLADAQAAEGDAAAVTGLADALDVKTVIEENEKVTAAALNDLNQRVGDLADLDEGIADKTNVVKAINAVKSAVESKNVTAEGDTYVSASAANNKVTVAATDSTKASLEKADTAVQEISVATEGQEVTVSEKSDTNGYTIGVTKAAYTKATDDFKENGAFTAEGLVDSALLKAYIADEIAKASIYWEDLTDPTPEPGA